MSKKTVFNKEVIASCLSIIAENVGNLCHAFDLCAEKHGGSPVTYSNSWYNVGGAKKSKTNLRKEADKDPVFFTMIEGEEVANRKNIFRKHLK